MLLLLLVIHVTLGDTEVIHTFFEDPCGTGSGSHSQSLNPTLGESSAAACAMECAVDVTCAAFSHPPCVLHSEEQCCSDHGAGHTFVKQVKSLYFEGVMK